MKCRKDIIGRKIWVDDENSYGTRPPSVEIVLLRDGEVYKSVTLDSGGDGVYKFPCLIIWKNKTEKYVYEIDEAVTPEEYTKTVRGYDIINTLNSINISGVKTWDDNRNEEGWRPAEITVRLLQNSVEVAFRQVVSPPDAEDTAEYDFGEMPFADAQGVPYFYTVVEEPVQYYEARNVGFNITNVYHPPIAPFWFTKESASTGAPLQNAVFELRKNGVLQDTATSGIDGRVALTASRTGQLQLTETVAPDGYQHDETVYRVMVSGEDSVTIEDVPAADFIAENLPVAYGLPLQRASAGVSEYSAAPNAWPLHGSGDTALYMTDKILIAPAAQPVTVKWDAGIRDSAYFSGGGGYDITDSYTDGVKVSANGDYTVYALFFNGYETVTVISIDRLRDGSASAPYLLLDYDTAADLEPLVPGTGSFVLDYMQGGGAKLALHYEIYENIDMSGRTWVPLGTLLEGFSGSLYGNGNDITGMAIVLFNANAGMFSRVSDGATIEAVGLTDFSAIGNGYIGGFAGEVIVSDGGTVVLRDLRLSGTFTADSNDAGGIVACAVVNDGTVAIDRCSAEAVMTGTLCGGILGICMLTSTTAAIQISNSNAGGTATGIVVAGGIAGGAEPGNGQFGIENCVNAMVLQGGIVGGIIGGVGNSENSVAISSCCNVGDIIGSSSAGGIIGNHYGASTAEMIEVENCYNTGAVSATGQGTVSSGGIAGNSSEGIVIRNCYNVGNTVSSEGTGQVAAGGIAGQYRRIENCAAVNGSCAGSQSDTARISQRPTGPEALLANNMAYTDMQVLIAGIPKTPLEDGGSAPDGDSASAAAVKAQQMYEDLLGWDFDGIWSFGNGEYTLPVLQGVSLSLQPDRLPPHL